MVESLINSTYQLGAKIGAGSFGKIYTAVNVNTQEEVAIKVEDINTKSPQLLLEAKLYQYLHSDNSEPAEGFPRMIQCITHSHYNLLVLELMGKSIDELFYLCDDRFSLKTVLMIAEQAITRVEYLHSKGFLHRDIKPENLLIGAGKQKDIIYMIDFGLSKKFMRDGKHIEFAEGKKLTGTARYSSINTHKGLEQSRRDDLETLGYTLIYLLKGSLPWQGIKAKEKQERYDIIRDAKLQTSLETLCEGLPKEFIEYMKYVRGLKFDEKPDYQMLRDLFKNLFYKKKYVEDFEFDWVVRAKEGRLDLSSINSLPSETKQTTADLFLESEGSVAKKFSFGPDRKTTNVRTENSKSSFYTFSYCCM
jgi:serine/threonine protein kinase